MIVQELPGCCGIRELNNLSRDADSQASIISFGLQCYEKHLEGTLKNEYGDDVRLDRDKFRYGLFSQANSPSATPNPATYGERFAAYIASNMLGEVTETGTHKNPNTGNLLKVWVWTIDHDEVKRHLATIGYGKDSQKGVEEPAIVMPTFYAYAAPPQVPTGGSPRARR